jgi:hypothetical protein
VQADFIWNNLNYHVTQKIYLTKFNGCAIVLFVKPNTFMITKNLNLRLSIDEQAQAAAGALSSLADCIRNLGSIPSGHLYARLEDYMSLETYQKLIGLLVEAGMVRQHSSHLLEWIGPRGSAVTLA